MNAETPQADRLHAFLVAWHARYGEEPIDESRWGAILEHCSFE
jgi:hypothetical protein